MEKFKKYENNPILKPTGNSWESLCVLNPAVIFDTKDDEFKMLYRAAGDDKQHYIYLGLATSKDGINFKRMLDKPVLAPTLDGADAGCVEDPRLIKLQDYYYLTYASRTFPPGQYWKEDKEYFGFKPEYGPTMLINNNSVTHLAISKDLVSFKKLGRISDCRYDDRDVIIFFDEVNKRFVRLSRPMEFVGEKYNTKVPSIWISYSNDMMEWDNRELLMTPEAWWEDAKIGGSCPPIPCKYGYFFIYHGVSSKDNAYRVGAVILDKNNPSKIIARTKDFLMEPEYEYETSGYYNGCVFPTGNVVKDGILYVYYGAADKYICLATANFDKLVEDLYNEGRL